MRIYRVVSKTAKGIRTADGRIFVEDLNIDVKYILSMAISIFFISYYILPFLHFQKYFT